MAPSRSIAASVVPVLAGCLGGLVAFWLLNRASIALQESLNPRPALLFGGAVLLVAAFLAVRFPLAGLVAGLVMGGLILLGWVTGPEPTVAMAQTSTDLPDLVMQHGAYSPFVIAGAATLVGVGAGLMALRRTA